MENEFFIKEILNEDGTKFDPPINPISEKYKRNCIDYTCMYCGRCPHGDYWKVPEEDREEYEKYRKIINDYVMSHNPSMKGD